jgi:zinc transport system ATP-binding protein
MKLLPVVEIKDLEFGYHETPILENVNLTIHSGEFIGIFGPNGGGKTTFLKVLMGFLKPRKGEIFLFQSSIKSGRPRIGYVPQVTRFDQQFPLSVLELVYMGLLSKSSWWGGISLEAKQKAQECLAKVGLLDKQHQAFGTLSGGQAQRALIARALASDPHLLLLDEPTASVDIDAEQEIYQILKSLKGTMTILMVTHHLQGIIDQAERLFCIQRLVTVVSPKDVCEHFALGLYHSPLLRLKSAPGTN